MALECEAVLNPDSIWPPMCPSIAAAYLFMVLFGITTVAHAAQMFLHRKPYSWVIVFSALMQTAAYVLRVLSIKYVEDENYYTYWFVFMMVAPVWTNAYAYMVMGRMVYNFTPSASIWKVKAWRFGLIFVLLDVLAFIIQVGGASLASQDDADLAMTGIHVYMGGIGFQQLCIFAFLFLAIRLHKRVIALPTSPEKRNAMILLYVNYTVVLLVTVRIIFRLIEYSDGLESAIPKQEAYQYVFDSAVMLVALVLYNIFHPGRMMPGKESNLPSRKVRKGWKNAGMEPHGRVGQDYLLPKYGEYSGGTSPPTGTSGGAGSYARVPETGGNQDVSFERVDQQEQGAISYGVVR